VTRAACVLLTLSGLACPSDAPAPTPTPTVETPAPPEGLHFVDGTEDAALGIRHHAGESAKRWMPEVMGSGVAVADFNRDGAPDLFFVDGGRIEGDRPPAARDRLLLNDGQGRFRDATKEWGLVSSGYGQGVAVGDVDNDGFPDLYLTTWEGHDRLLRNTGTGFEDITAASGIDAPRAWSSSAAFLDADGDGNLDLYIAYYADYDRETARECFTGGILTYCSPIQYRGLPDRLLRGHGDGTFEDRTEDWIGLHYARSLAVAAGDIDLDGDTDLYVAADLTRNLLFVNDGTGKMLERARSAGVAYSEVGAEEAGMGADFSDYDGDGLVDIVCSNFQHETTAVYRQESGGFFSERSDAIGVGAAARARLTFGVDFFDADNDGDEDLLIVNGHIEPEIAKRSTEGGFAQANTLFENIGGRFRDVTERAGPALADVSVSRGLVTSDLDGDGDLDFVITNRGGKAQLGRNETVVGGFLNLWLEGTTSNRSAIGTLVTAKIGDSVSGAQVMGAQSYLSVSDRRVHLGLGDATTIDELTIHWPQGEPQSFTNVKGGRFLRLVQGGKLVAYTPGAGVIPP
jgi:hypothetical protein